MDLLEHLNPPQREAVTHQEGPLLILAGAGSGKTRVITHRIAHLIDQGAAHPEQLLAVTFTNRAADEMRERVDALLRQIGQPEASAGITISTFHSLGARLLRRHADRLGLDWSFQIYDDVDQIRLVRELLRARDMDSGQAYVRRMRGYIERMKNRGIPPRRAHEIAYNPQDEEAAWFYEAYQRTLHQANCLDFGDLILGVLQIFRQAPGLAASYSRQWRFLMVDEFQDTNPSQYELLDHLTTEHDNLAVVGDDDQAIYRWRGATITNILGFEKDHEGTRVIKLEQNYRSTQIILDAADDVIQHNPERRDKKLWTEQEGGESIGVFTARDGREEAQWVAEKIRLLAAETGDGWGEFAVFFRTNAQARLFEEQLRFASVPYQIVGGTSFYQRAEVKDLLAYLKVALNPENQVDLLRVINTPTRGVGQATLGKLLGLAQIDGVETVFDAIRFVLGADVTLEGDVDLITPRPRDLDEDEVLVAVEQMRAPQIQGVRDFYETLQGLRDDLLHFDSLAELLRQFIERIHYFAHIEAKHPEVADDKQRNVAELVSAIEEFERDFDPGDSGTGTFQSDDLIESSHSMLSDAPAVRTLRAFLDQSALVQPVEGLDEDEEAADRVTLMTVHGSKGLEFTHVFLVGMEDDLFPSVRDPSDEEELHEERRLAYVAITRARERLFITNARRRRVYGSMRENAPSRFLLDIDPERLVIDPKSSADILDWTPRRRRRRPPTDDELYFRDGQAADMEFSFDQSSELVDGEPTPDHDEFSQLVPADWDDWGGDAGTSHEDAPSPEPSRDEASLVGKVVTHVRFGIGEIKAVSGSGDRANVTVAFPGAGEKTIVRRFLKVFG